MDLYSTIYSTNLLFGDENMNKTDNPQGFVLDLYKQANLPLVQERLFGELSGKDVMMYNRVWTYLEGSLTFAATALQAIAFFVKDLALTVLALIPAIISSDARRFVEVHVAHMLQDLVAIPVGIIGFVSPHAGTFLAKTAINLFISLFQDSEAKEGKKSTAEKLHEFNGEVLEATALGVHLLAQMASFEERGAALEKERDALFEGEGKFDEEACGAIDQKRTDLDAEKQAWIQDHSDQIRQAKKGLFAAEMPYVCDVFKGDGDDFVRDFVPTFKDEHEGICDTVWNVAEGEQTLEDLMDKLGDHCGTNYGVVRDALQEVVDLGGDSRAKACALIREVQKFLPALFERHVDLFGARPLPVRPLPVFRSDHQAICDTVWNVANEEQTLEDLMDMLEEHCRGNSGIVREELQGIVDALPSAPQIVRALTLEIQEFMPHLFVSTFSDDDDEFFGSQGAVPAGAVPARAHSTAHAVAERPAYADHLDERIDVLVRFMNSGARYAQDGIKNFLGDLTKLREMRDEIKGGPEERASLKAALEEKLLTMYGGPHTQRDFTADQVRDILRQQEIPGLVVADPVVELDDSDELFLDDDGW